MYFSTGGVAFRGGHGSAGVPEPRAHWFFAEGATGSFFNTFLLLANPDETRTAHVTVSYLLTDGTVIPVTHDIAPSSRQTYNVATEAPALASAAMSAVVESDVPIVAERSMYWPPDWTEAHNTPGAIETGTVWAVAGGEEGGAFNAQTYVLVANTSAFAGSARVTVLRENAAPLTLDVDARSQQPHERADWANARIRRGDRHPLRRAGREPRRHARADRRRTRDLQQWRRRRRLGRRKRDARDAAAIAAIDNGRLIEADQRQIDNGYQSWGI